jgi:hypothetical protein
MVRPGRQVASGRGRPHHCRPETLALARRRPGGFRARRAGPDPTRQGCDQAPASHALEKAGPRAAGHGDRHAQELWCGQAGDHTPGSSIGSTRASTTRAENSHQPTRRRERQRKRFKSPRQVQRFLSIRDLIANLFHFRRDRVSAADYRAARTQAFEAWAEVVGAGMGQQVDGADEISKPNQYLHRSRRRSLCKRSHLQAISHARPQSRGRNT